MKRSSWCVTKTTVLQFLTLTYRTQHDFVSGVFIGWTFSKVIGLKNHFIKTRHSNSNINNNNNNSNNKQAKGSPISQRTTAVWGCPVPLECVVRGVPEAEQRSLVRGLEPAPHTAVVDQAVLLIRRGVLDHPWPRSGVHTRGRCGG